MCQKVHYLYPTIYSRYSMTRLRNTVTTMLLLRYTFFSITYYTMVKMIQNFISSMTTTKKWVPVTEMACFLKTNSFHCCTFQFSPGKKRGHHQS